jgi:endogenous inhibitor of DNA gyrase (YacG/DUF329 family)
MTRKNMGTMTCPACCREFVRQGNPHRPFCSLTCRLIDLGIWLDEGYRIPGETVSDESTLDDRVPHDSG